MALNEKHGGSAAAAEAAGSPPPARKESFSKWNFVPTVGGVFGRAVKLFTATPKRTLSRLHESLSGSFADVTVDETPPEEAPAAVANSTTMEEDCSVSDEGDSPSFAMSPPTHHKDNRFLPAKFEEENELAKARIMRRRYSVDQGMTVEVAKDSTIHNSFERQFVFLPNGDLQIVPTRELEVEHIQAHWKLYHDNSVEVETLMDSWEKNLRSTCRLPNRKRMEYLSWRAWFQKRLKERVLREQATKMLLSVDDATTRLVRLSLRRLSSDYTLPTTPRSPIRLHEAETTPTLRFVCISDTHSLHHNIPMDSLPAGDVVVHCGDFTDTGTEREVTEFVEWFSHLPYKYKIFIGGNHDITLEPDFYERNWRRWHHPSKKQDPAKVQHIIRQACRDDRSLFYLEDSGIVLEGIPIYGTPWQPAFFDWAFNLYEKEDLAKKWAMIPSNTQVLITHSPPWGYGDLVNRKNHVGCNELLNRVRDLKIPFHVFGHVHEGYGSFTDGVTKFFNASTCTLRYHPHNCALVFDVPTSHTVAMVDMIGP